MHDTLGFFAVGFYTPLPPPTRYILSIYTMGYNITHHLPHRFHACAATWVLDLGAYFQTTFTSLYACGSRFGVHGRADAPALPVLRATPGA